MSSGIRDHLQAIYDQRGQLTPPDVVDEAAGEESPLHNYFEWDDTTAAGAYRLVQARELIRRVNVRFERASGEVVQVRAFVHDPTTPEDDAQPLRGRYVPVHLLVRDLTKQDAVLDEMRRDIEELRRRYGHLKEFWQIVSGMAA